MIRSLAARARRSLHGHYWTYAGFVLSQLTPPAPLDDVPVRIDARAEGDRAITLSARFTDRPQSDTCVLVLHGLGGDVSSRYVQLATHAARARGVSVLRLGFRGADLEGADVYHAGLLDDVRAALASPLLSRFSRLEIVGYSMGGHITLSYAASRERDPRVAAVAAVCAPLDLAAGVRAIQRPDRRPYQFHVLRSLKAAYRKVEERAEREGRTLPHTADEVDRATTIRDWDALVVCPRFGFRDPEHYYESCSAGPKLASIEVPTLLAIAEADPMVPLATLHPWIERTSDAITTWRYERGGHVAFPAGARRDTVSVEDELVAWLAERGSTESA
ncbi:MAG: alpha/beta fold hydrolase [Sandaracinus sp.]